MAKAAIVTWESLVVAGRRYRIGRAGRWWVADVATSTGFADSGVAATTRGELEAKLRSHAAA